MNEKATCKNCTNEKEKQIEEMAKIILYCPYPDADMQAKRFYENGYRKIPEDSVVLSKEEFNLLLHNNTRLDIEYLEREKAKASKETAKEILKEFALSPRTRAMIAEKYGLSKEDLGEV